MAGIIGRLEALLPGRAADKRVTMEASSRMIGHPPNRNQGCTEQACVRPLPWDMQRPDGRHAPATVSRAPGKHNLLCLRGVVLRPAVPVQLVGLAFSPPDNPPAGQRGMVGAPCQ